MASIESEAPTYRESEAVKLWSARLALSHSYEEFEHTAIRVAGNNGQRYTGFITKGEDGEVTSFTRTRYPRKKYGIASIAECEAGMATLATELNAVVRPDAQSFGFRVVMGLVEGYDQASPKHTTEEVSAALIGAEILSADVFAVRHTTAGISVYSEPVAVVRAPLNMLADVYNLGDAFRQERFTIEDFERCAAYVVETRYCTEPDC